MQFNLQNSLKHETISRQIRGISSQWPPPLADDPPCFLGKLVRRGGHWEQISLILWEVNVHLELSVLARFLLRWRWLWKLSPQLLKDIEFTNEQRSTFFGHNFGLSVLGISIVIKAKETCFIFCDFLRWSHKGVTFCVHLYPSKSNIPPFTNKKLSEIFSVCSS